MIEKVQNTEIRFGLDYELIETPGRDYITAINLRIGLRVLSGDGSEALALSKEIERFLADKMPVTPG